MNKIIFVILTFIRLRPFELHLRLRRVKIDQLEQLQKRIFKVPTNFCPIPVFQFFRTIWVEKV